MLPSRRMLLPAAVLGVAAVVPFLGCGCTGDGPGAGNWPDRPGPKVVVSFAPLYCFVANVAGDDAVVKNMMTTTGPHSFHPTDVEARLLARADLFFINGLDLDNRAAETLRKGSANAGLRVIDLGGRLPKELCLEGTCHHDHGHGHAHDHEHEHGTDPHVWLGIDQAVKMVEAVRDELKAADPAHADGYDRRAAEYVGKLQAVKADGLAMLKGKDDLRMVTFHESLAYFARTFGLRVSGVVMKNPGVEPNAEQMGSLVKTCVSKKVRVIAVEPQYSKNSSAAKLLVELKRGGLEDATLVEIDPLETVRPADLKPEWYEAKMRANLKALAEAMK